MPRHRPLPARAAPTALLLAGILLIAANLRAPVTGLAPVLATIQASFGLGTAQAGLLPTLPLLAFALLSPVAPLLARRIGLERARWMADEHGHGLTVLRAIRDALDPAGVMNPGKMGL